MYRSYPIGTQIKDESGNYIYAKETTPNRWRPIYIGQTSSLMDRLVDHEKETCAKRHGATHIHAHTSSSSEQVRKREESDLILNYSPACNEKIG
jgi:hypothetical protein